jgi:hypothetical protein
VKGVVEFENSNELTCSVADGTVMICCRFGSGSDFGTVLAPVQVPVPDPDSSFQKTKKNHKILPFNVRSRLFPRKLASPF